MAGRGGKREGAGRKPGSVTKATRNVAERVLTSGELTPLDYMLSIMRDAQQDSARRDDMAKAAAPYIHAKLQAITADVKLTSVGEALDAAANG